MFIFNGTLLSDFYDFAIFSLQKKLFGCFSALNPCVCRKKAVTLRRFLRAAYAYVRVDTNEKLRHKKDMNEIAVIQRKIYEIRGQKVILDRDLAALYQVETKVLNQAVKRNIDRFPEDFMFQLTLKEWREIAINEGVIDLKSQIVTSNWGGVRKMPYAFTEHGVVMLASLLRSEIAVKMSVQITRAFVAMRQALVALTATEAKVELLNEKIERLNLYIEEVMHDQNDVNEMQRAINEETAMQLELINQSLAELQAKPEQKLGNPVGFNSPMYKDEK